MFRELYKNDNQMIALSDELMAQISQRMRMEIEKPTKLFWLKTQSVSRLAGMAAALILVVAASVVLPVMMNGGSVELLGEDTLGKEAGISSEHAEAELETTSADEPENETGEIANFGAGSRDVTETTANNAGAAQPENAGDMLEATAENNPGGTTAPATTSEATQQSAAKKTTDDNTDSSAGVDGSGTTQGGEPPAGDDMVAIAVESADEGAGDVAEAGDIDIEYEAENPIAVGGEGTDDVEGEAEIFYDDVEIAEEAIDENFDYDIAEDAVDDALIDESIVDNAVDPDFLSYTEWTDPAVWSKLVTSDIEPVEMQAPEWGTDKNDVAIDSGLISNLTNFRAFCEMFLNGKQEIYTFACTNTHGVYPNDAESYYGVDDMTEFFSPVYALFNTNLGKKIAYYPTNAFDPYIAYPYFYKHTAIKIGIITATEHVVVYIDDTDNMVIQVARYVGRYEIKLEKGTYKKLWNYINF